MKSSRLLPWFRSWSRRVPILHGILIAQLIMLPSSTSRGVWVDVDSDGDGIFDTGYDDGTSPPDTTPPPEPEPNPDSDGDHLSDADEAAAGSNPYSPDSDGDGITDADEVNLTGTDPTSADSDGDGISDYNEFYGNSTVDEDTSGPGETPYDYDGDGIADPVDPDPLSPQNDPDSDGDYVPDSQDSDPYNPAVWNDANGNGVNDDAEVPNHDTDGDGVSNDTDSHPADPTLYNDWNYNGQNDGDEDADGDGVTNLQDSHPNSNCLWCDWNGNGVNDDVEAGTADNDGDGHADNADSHPFNNGLWEDWNSNGWNDSAESVNSDGDAQPDFSDSDPQDPNLWEDWNRNGSNDGTEPPPNPDRDNDLMPNENDSDPDNSALWCDWNRNGINDTVEPPPLDQDSDGHPDSEDSDPGNSNLWDDWNHNGYNDSVEGQYLDDDSDTHPNAFDTHPQDALLWSDHNGNGINDECEVIITDSDGDGYNDDLDTHPSNATLWNDHNDNGINDELELPPDRDGDSIPDSQDEFPDDFDNDGLTDADEISRGSNPASRDTDGDGLTDGEEVYAGTNLLNVDTDADGLTDFEELRAYQSDPLTCTIITLTPPSNGALSSGSNNTSSISTPSATPISALKNYYKLKAAAAWSLTASMADDDGDRIPNAVEELYAPLIVTPDGDLDGDLVSNLQEYQEGTDLNGASAGDFDGDGISDVIEDSWWTCCSKYRFNDAYADPDGDGLLTIEELVCTHGGRSTIKGMVATSPIHQCSGPTSATTATTYNVVTRRMPGIKPGENPMMSWQNRASVYQQWMTDGTLRLAILDAQSRLQLTTAAQIVTFFTRDLLFSPASHSLYIPLVGYDHVPRGYLRWLENKGLATPPLGGSGAGILNSLDTSATTTASADIDGDGMPNFWEARYNLNFRSGLDANMVFKAAEGASDAVKALAAAKQARYKDEYGLIRAYPAVYAAGGFYNQTEWDILNRLDPDHDGLPNLLEYKLNANPLLADLSAVISRNTDTDGDGYADIEELLLGTNPESASSNPATLSNTGIVAPGLGSGNTPPPLPNDPFIIKWNAPRVTAAHNTAYNKDGSIIVTQTGGWRTYYPSGSPFSVTDNFDNYGQTEPENIGLIIPMCTLPTSTDAHANWDNLGAFGSLMQSHFAVSDRENFDPYKNKFYRDMLSKLWRHTRAQIKAVNPDSSSPGTVILNQPVKVTCLRTKTTTRAIPLAPVTQVLGTYTFTIPAGDCKSEVFPTMLSFPLLHPADSDTPGSVEYNLLPIDLATDLNNDGQITSADSSLRDAATKSGASDDAKEKGTEYLFINDKMSNGVWDADDDGVMSYSYGSGYSTMPKPPATHKDDDDAEPLKVQVGGLNSGVVWFDHPTIDKLEFFKTKECKASDKLNMTSSSPFDLSTGTLPDTIFMRLRDDWAGTDQEGNLRMFVGKTVNETWAELKLPLTVVRDFGAKHFFHAARDYILENNSRVCIRDHGYPFGPNPSVIFRLCVMREEATKMAAFDAKAGGQSGIEAAYLALPAVPRIPAVVINGNQCFWSAGWDESNPFDLPNMLGNIADKCHGRVIHGSVTAATSSDNFDNTTKPAAGSPLAGPDPIPAGTLAGPDGVVGTADDIANPYAGDPGGKYVGNNSGAWTFAAGRAGGSDALGGLSTNYGSAERADKAHQMMGYAKGLETGKGCIFTATQIKGVGYGTIVKGDASIAGVPALSPSADAGAIKLFILDSGAGSLALMHIDPAGTMRGAYMGRKTSFGFPYYVNNYLALDPAPARP